MLTIEILVQAKPLTLLLRSGIPRFGRLCSRPPRAKSFGTKHTLREIKWFHRTFSLANSLGNFDPPLFIFYLFFSYFSWCILGDTVSYFQHPLENRFAPPPPTLPSSSAHSTMEMDCERLGVPFASELTDDREFFFIFISTFFLFCFSFFLGQWNFSIYVHEYFSPMRLPEDWNSHRVYYLGSSIPSFQFINIFLSIFRVFFFFLQTKYFSLSQW